MKTSNFRDWTLDSLDKTFGMRQVLEKECPSIQKWKEQALQETISDINQSVLVNLQEPFQWGGKAWNEFELENKFISPLIMLVRFDDRKIGYFLERKLEGIVNDYTLSGIVDGMIATGFRNPDIPFFCMHEYAPTSPMGTDSISPHWGDARGASGFPDAQALVAMMVAREINENKKPIYGMYIVGFIWNFMLLEGNEYCISKSYNAEDEEVFEIFKMLKALKHIIKTELM